MFLEFNEFFKLQQSLLRMVSKVIKSSKLPIRHLAKTFYFVLSFHFKAKSKDLANLI
jgi:hypothetical protein